MIPKYEQIKQDLLSEIKNHKFIPGDKFYSEADIKRKYEVSSITAVKALNQLTSAGYLYRKFPKMLNSQISNCILKITKLSKFCQ